MKIQMTDVCTYMSGICKTNLGIHICPIHIYKAAIRMDNL